MKKMFFLFLLLSQSVFGADNITSADSIDFYMRHVVVTANRYEKNAFETSIPVNTIQHRVVWQSGLDNAGEVLEKKAGVNFAGAGPWSQKPVIRGLAGAQVLTLVDGMRLDVLRSYGNHAPLIDVNQIEKIEVIRGPASTLYGSEAIAGVVNYITINPSSTSDKFSLTGSAGLQYASVNNQKNESLTLHSSYRNWYFLLGLTNRTADDVKTPMGKLINTSYSGYALNAKIKAQYFSRHFFILSGQSNRMSDVGVPVDPFASRAKFLLYNRDVASLSYEFRSPGSVWTSTKANIHYQEGDRNFEAYIDHKPKGLLFVDQLLNANRNVKSWGANLQNSFSISGNNYLTAGIDIFAEFDDTKRIADAAIFNNAGNIVKDPPADRTPPTPASNRKSAGLFVEDEHNINSKITLTLGSRFDHTVSHADGIPGTLVEQSMDLSDSDFSGGLGMLYRLNKHVRLMVNVGRAFKAPTLQERFFSGTAQVGYLRGNPALDSENSLNIDSGFKWQSERFSGECNLFRNRINNFIVMKPVSAAADTFLYDNVGNAVLFGGEFYAEYKPVNRMRIFMDAAYVSGDDTKRNMPLPKMPPFQGSLGIRYETPDQSYWIELSGRFIYKQGRVAENEGETEGYNLFNFSSGINIGRFFNLSSPLHLTFNVRNLFDESHRDHLSYVTWWDAPGRNFIIGLRGNF